MKRRIILILLVIAGSVTSGFARCQTESEEIRDVKNFTKVSFGISGNLYIKFGPQFKVILEGERKHTGNIITEVSGNKLVIKDENWRMNNWKNIDEKVTVYITMPEISSLGVSGSGKAEIKDAVKAENMSLNVSGSGKIYTTDINASFIECGISGSGDIIFGGRGNTSRAEISISGSGNYYGEAMKIESADIHISGSGNCRCYVTENLRAGVSGSGNVSYEGAPRVDTHVSGSGKVRSK